MGVDDDPFDEQLRLNIQISIFIWLLHFSALYFLLSKYKYTNSAKQHLRSLVK